MVVLLLSSRRRRTWCLNGSGSRDVFVRDTQLETTFLGERHEGWAPSHDREFRTICNDARRPLRNFRKRL